MKPLTLILILAAFLGVAMPMILEAVAIPSEWLKKIPPASEREMVYGIMVVVFVIGIALGVWIQGRLKSH